MRERQLLLWKYSYRKLANHVVLKLSDLKHEFVLYMSNLYALKWFLKMQNIYICGIKALNKWWLVLTLSRYLSRISWPQLAHMFLPVEVEVAELAVEVGEHTEGVDGELGAERGSSRSMVDLWDSPSDWDCTQGRTHSGTSPPPYDSPCTLGPTSTGGPIHLHSSPHTRHLFILVLCTNPRICEN